MANFSLEFFYICSSFYYVLHGFCSPDASCQFHNKCIIPFILLFNIKIILLPEQQVDEHESELTWILFQNQASRSTEK